MYIIAFHFLVVNVLKREHSYEIVLFSMLSALYVGHRSLCYVTQLL
jgi:hypothetical protein